MLLLHYCGGMVGGDNTEAATRVSESTYTALITRPLAISCCLSRQNRGLLQVKCNARVTLQGHMASEPLYIKPTGHVQRN